MTTVKANTFFDSSSLKFAHSRQVPFQQLPGFQKHHSVPQSNNSVATSFINRFVKSELESEFQQIHTFVRQQFGLKRKELEVTLDGHGSAVLETPLFVLSKSYELTEDAPDQITCRIVLESVSDLNTLANPNFEVGFPYKFQELEIGLNASLDIEKVIDAFEEMEDGQPFQLQYDYAATSCELIRPASQMQLRMSTDKLQLVAPRRSVARDLLVEWSEFECLLATLLT